MNMYDWTQDVGPGWKKIVQRLVDQANKEGAVIGQVKEKFGGLRFYLDSPCSEKLSKMIDEAENESFATCEVCGEPGSPGGKRWIKTLCDRHHNNREKK